MANRLITLRLGNKLLKEIDSALHTSSFENRTEFIKHSVRAMLREINEDFPEKENIRKQKAVETELSEEIAETTEELKYVR